MKVSRLLTPKVFISFANKYIILFGSAPVLCHSFFVRDPKVAIPVLQKLREPHQKKMSGLEVTEYRRC